MKKAIGIDLGDARVGVAWSDDLGMLAVPLETIRTAKTDVLRRIVELVAAKQAEVIVVGMPRNMDGSFGPAAQKTKDFIAALEPLTSCRIIPWDERLTTVSAQRSLREAGKTAKQQKAVIDQVAAQIILQSWLDAQP